jgi:hypothetical protein
VTSCQLLVVSHLQGLLDELPADPGIVPVNLNNLNIPKELNTDSLGENRLFLQPAVAGFEAKWVGTFSARFDERFPTAPKLHEIPTLFKSLTITSGIWGPQVTRIESKADLQIWIKMQDAVHPGLSRILLSIEKGFFANSRTAGWMPWSNQVVVDSSVWNDFVEFWNEAFRQTIEQYGLTPDFDFRCTRCGRRRRDGFARYSKSRLLGFIGERITQLFFAHQADLQFLPIEGGRVHSYSGIPQALRRIIAVVPQKVLVALWVTSRTPKRRKCSICSQ